MSLKRLIAYSCSSDDDTITHIKDLMVSAGWTLHDDQSANDYYVLYSNGESGNEMRAYAEITHAVENDKIHIHLWQQWDNSGHSGSIKLSHNTEHGISITDAGGHHLWVWANKDFVFCVCKVGSSYMGSGIIQNSPLYPSATLPLGVLQSGVSAGSSVVCQLATGEADNFNTSDTYRIVGSASGEGRYNVTLSSVDTGNDQITIASLTGDKSAGSKIGFFPYRWSALAHNNRNGMDSRAVTGTTNPTYPPNSLLIHRDSTYYPIDPDEYLQKYTMWPALVHDYYSGALPAYTGPYVLHGLITNSTYESTVSVGDLVSGTSTGSNGASTLNDTGKSWTTNAYAGKTIILTAGTGAGQIRAISSNTSTQVTVDEAWATTPDSSTEYVICNQGWRFFGFGNDAYGKYIREA